MSAHLRNGALRITFANAPNVEGGKIRTQADQIMSPRSYILLPAFASAFSE